MRQPHELLYDSEASLRLVDRAIGDLSPVLAEREPAVPAPLRQRLSQSGDPSDEVRGVLDEFSDTAAIVVRFCQSAGMLDPGGMDALQQMPGRLRAVSTRTETAATDILDGLARAAALVNTLDRAEGLSDDARHVTAESLRDELSSVTNHLQFEDITSQQLAEIATLLADVRYRIAQVVSIFTAPAPTNSTHIGPEEGQTLADEICEHQRATKTA